MTAKRSNAVRRSRHLPGWAALSSLPGSALASSPSAEDVPELRPPLPELPPTFWEQHGSWIVFLAILVAASAVLGIAWLRRAKPTAAEPIEIHARRRLEALRQRPEDGDLLSEVSRVLKRYLAVAFELPSGELTTAEFCQAFQGHRAPGTELAESVSSFLRQCDALKFSPDEREAPVGAADRALTLVEMGEARRAQWRQPATADAGDPSRGVS